MKKLVTLVLVVIATTLTGCSSDDGVGSTQGDIFLKFIYNGQQYNFEPETITTLQKLILGSGVQNNEQTSLSLWMPQSPSINSYQITNDTPTDANSNILSNAIITVGDVTYEATSGSLVITSVTQDYVEGKFSFTAVDENDVTISITGGSFKAYN